MSNRKLYLARDVASGHSGRMGELHLFDGTKPPDFDNGFSFANDHCDYMGEVTRQQVRGEIPKAGDFCEVIILTKGS